MALDLSPTRCDVIYTGAQTTWCCDSLGQPDVDNGRTTIPPIEDDAWQDIYYGDDDA